MDLSALDLNHYAIATVVAGLLVALVVWLPVALKRLPLSLPIVCVLLGAGFFSLPGFDFKPLPWTFPKSAERISEFVVIVALMGAGLKIDRAFNVRKWTLTWRLIGITMPLSIVAITVLGAVSGLAWASALLLAAALAPTDPVLAADVQVGPPLTGQEDEVRFGLTSEAGLNDGLAFPFVHLAIVISLAATSGEPWFARWLSVNVIWEIAGGIAFGWMIGRLFGWLVFKMPGGRAVAKTGDGLIAVSATLVSYGVTELLHCYGFLAVFVTALTIRHADRQHDYQREMHDIAEQLERLAMMVLLLLFGGALVNGLLRSVGLTEIVFAVVTLLVIRPGLGLVSLWGFKASNGEKATIAFFGIRGIGTIYYMAYGLNHGHFEDAQRLWGVAGLVVLMSILLHGLTVTPAMRLLDRSHGRDPDNP